MNVLSRVIFWALVAAFGLVLLFDSRGCNRAYSQTVRPSPSPASSPAPATAQEWWDWFSAQKTATIKSDVTVRGGSDIRPLLSEITLSDPKLLPAGIWGVRKYRKYIQGPGGLWNQGTFYEIIKLPGEASAKDSVISWEATVSKDPKYSPVAEAVAP